MGVRTYRLLNTVCRFIKQQCAREVILGRENVPIGGGFIMACTHVSHMEPMLISTILHDRPIHWMARLEFYRYFWSRRMLDRVLAFPVHRQGVPVSSIRTGIRLASEGRIVGIFPEGGCRVGKHLAIRGGKIKQGVCVIACRAQVPIVPVVVIGTNRMTHVSAWFPGKDTRLWIAFGKPIAPLPPPKPTDRRRTRDALAEQVEAEYQRLYQLILSRGDVDDGFTP